MKLRLNFIMEAETTTPNTYGYKFSKFNMEHIAQRHSLKTKLQNCTETKLLQL